MSKMSSDSRAPSIARPVSPVRISAVLAALMAAAIGSTVRAQAPTTKPNPGGQDAVTTFRVLHDHAVGSGKGVLVITPTGFEYRGTDDEARHSHTWRDLDVKRLELDRQKITLTTYEAGSIPVLPRQLPFVKETVAIPAGVEHRYEFRLRDGELSPVVAAALEVRFPRPIASSIVASDAATLGELIFELPVFHRHRAGGHSGVLRVYARCVVFAAETGSSRSWRYADIRSISRLGDRRFEISTDEGQFGPGGRDYVFDLKRPMRDREYEGLWSRVYEHRFGEGGE
jgi:hypothetical protein